MEATVYVSLFSKQALQHFKIKKRNKQKKPQTFTNNQPKQQSPAERKLTFLSWKYLIPFLGHF